MSCVSLNVTGELAVRGDSLTEVLWDEDSAADALLLDRPDLILYKHSVYCIE